MADIDILAIAEAVQRLRPPDAKVAIEPPSHHKSALHIMVDGNDTATSTCVWPSGACEITYATVPGGIPHIEEHHLQADEATMSVVTQFIQALERAETRHAPNSWFKPNPHQVR